MNRCEYEYNEFMQLIDFGCGKSLEDVMNTPSKLGLRFCPFCGKRLRKLKVTQAMWRERFGEAGGR